MLQGHNQIAESVPVKGQVHPRVSPGATSLQGGQHNPCFQIKGLEFRDDKCKVTDPVGTWARTGTQGSRGIFTRKDASLCLKFREEASLHLAPPRDRSPGRLVEGPRKGFSHCAQRSLRSSQWFLRAFVGRRNGEAEGTSELTVPPASKPTRESPFPCFIY